MKAVRVALIIALAVSFRIQLISGPVSESQARKVALNFLFERVPSFRATAYSQLDISEVIPVTADELVLYYVMNFKDGGFMAIAATDAVYPVLCYSFDGKYSAEDQPENFRAWMLQYQGEILKVIDEGLTPTPEVRLLWDNYLEAEPVQLHRFSGREVLPLLTSDWDQDKYYNEMCPADGGGPGGHCYAGCVATAMGQILNYFRWPNSGTGSYTYYCPPYDSLSADFSAAEYRWDLMEPNLGHSNLEVAELLYHLGVSVDMVYGPDGSGMYNHKAAYSMRTYFKYSPETQYVYRDSTFMDWDSLLIAHLDQRIPMYYAGWSVPNINGHAFVCDGYQGTDFYHFNWGWDAAYNGYFYTDNLTPGGSNFNLAQELIIHAVPDTSQYQYPVNCQGDITYTNLFGTLEDGSGPIYPYANGSDCSWLIAPDDSVNFITLDILNYDLADGDTLFVYDGNTLAAPLLAAFSGDTVPGDVVSSANYMLVRFVSDGSGNAEGFLASFESEIPVYCSGTTVMNAQSDTLSDGSGTYDYHNNSVCTWMINPPGASALTLYFTEFATEEGFDYLKIYDLANSQLLAELTGTYPGGTPEPVTSPSGKMFIAFSTNYSGTESGWTAYYETDLVEVAEMQSQEKITIYPNPAGDVISIVINDPTLENGMVYITDLTGKVLIKDRYDLDGDSQFTIDVNEIGPGMYLLVLEQEGKPFACKKLLKM